MTKNSTKSKSLRSKKHSFKLAGKNTKLDTLKFQNSLELLNIPNDKKASDNNTKSKTVTHPIFVNKNLKDVSYSRRLAVTRKNLSSFSRILSRFLHTPLIEKLNEFMAETIARPIALTGGSVAAFLGTFFLLLVSSHYGYSYNYSATLILFVAGMIFTLAVETVFRVIRKLK